MYLCFGIIFVKYDHTDLIVVLFIHSCKSCNFNSRVIFNNIPFILPLPLCHLFKESSPAPRSLLKSLPAAPSRPAWTPEASSGRDRAKGKDFNKDQGARA